MPVPSIVGYATGDAWIRNTGPGADVTLSIAGAQIGNLMTVYTVGVTLMNKPTGWNTIGGESLFSGDGLVTFGAWRIVDGTEGSTVTVHFPPLQSGSSTPLANQLYNNRWCGLAIFDTANFPVVSGPSTNWRIASLSQHNTVPVGTQASWTGMTGIITGGAVIFLGATFFGSGLQTSLYGYDPAPTEILHLDATVPGLVELAHHTGYSEHVIADADPRLQSASYGWWAAAAPTTGTTFPAVTNIIEGSNTVGVPTRVMHESGNVSGIVPVTYSYWGTRVSPKP